MPPTVTQPIFARLLEIRRGRSEAFGPSGYFSAIRKQVASGPIAVNRLGLAGDQQADRQHHGGTEKAVHHYPAEHYSAWQEALPHRTAPIVVGDFGENFSSFGLNEGNVCVGDVFRVGGAVLQVSQIRQPCWKLNVRFDVADMARRVQDSGRTGWYYRVIEEGEICPDQRLELIERPHAEWPLSRVLRLLYRDCLDLSELRNLICLDALAQGMRELAAKRIATGLVEDWGKRLSTP